jgi:hypothetical protein
MALLNEDAIDPEAAAIVRLSRMSCGWLAFWPGFFPKKMTSSPEVFDEENPT